MHHPDPLRFIPFHRRYQTHTGNSIPLGISESSFSDLLSGTSSILTQTESSKQPILAFQSGIPFLHFDGSNDFLSESFSLPQPIAIILAYRNHTLSSPGSHDIIFETGPDSEAVGNLIEDNRPYSYITAGPGELTTIERTLANGVFSIITAIYNDQQSSIRLNSQTVTSGHTNTTELSGLTLGSALSGRSAGIDIIACLIPKNLADISICEQYLSTLLP